MRSLREFTSARVGLGRAGHSVPTAELLDFQLAHARARDAIYSRLDVRLLVLELKTRGIDAAAVASQAPDRAAYLRRPDLGRRLDAASCERLAAIKTRPDTAFVIADGLSALAVERHALPLLDALRSLQPNLSPAVVIVEQGRVAIGDEIAARLGAPLVAVLIGERPGLTSPDSLGVYLTWNPRPGSTTDADRNCISNIRSGGLSYELAAHKLLYLISEAQRRKLTGVQLKELSPYNRLK